MDYCIFDRPFIMACMMHRREDDDMKRPWIISDARGGGPRTFAYDRRGGFTLTEVLIVGVCSGLLLSLMVRAVLGINQLNYHSAQRFAAYGLCRERLEEARVADYDDLVVGSRVETVRFGHLGGVRRQALEGQLTTVIESHTLPMDRRHVEVAVAWRHGDRNFRERAATIVYPPHR
jgi:type II secretory pathway pseudopilin PulG